MTYYFFIEQMKHSWLANISLNEHISNKWTEANNPNTIKL